MNEVMLLPIHANAVGRAGYVTVSDAIASARHGGREPHRRPATLLLPRYFTAAILSRIPGAQAFASSEARYIFCA